jgi:hypothetical protein
LPTGTWGDILNVWKRILGKNPLKWWNMTDKGAKAFNMGTNMTRCELERSLLQNGWTKTVIKDGIFEFKNGAEKYVLRNVSKSQVSEWTAEWYGTAEKVLMEIRLGAVVGK